MKTEIEIKNWKKRGGMLINTEFLEWDDPDHPYNQAISQGVVPEDFGLKHPLYSEFEDRSKASLITEVVNLRRELLACHAAGF